MGIFLPTDNLKSNRIDKGDRKVLNGVNLTWFFGGKALKLMERVAYVSPIASLQGRLYICIVQSGISKTVVRRERHQVIINEIKDRR